MLRIANIEDLSTLKRVGYWKSESEPLLPHPGVLIDEAWDRRERDQVIAYLEASYLSPVFWCGHSWCRFGCPSHSTDLGSADLTDGTWIFPEGFVHYLRSHHVKPPYEFLEYVRRRGFRVPELPIIDVKID
jgi:hypothetical protein